MKLSGFPGTELKLREMGVGVRDNLGTWGQLLQLAIFKGRFSTTAACNELFCPLCSHLENTLAGYLFEDSDSYMYILMPIKQDKFGTLWSP